MLFYIRSMSVVVYACFSLAGVYAQGFDGHRTHSITKPLISKPQSPIQVDLELLNTPASGEALEFNVVLTTMVDSNNINARVTLPEGSKLLEGDLSWQGSLSRNDQTSFYLKVKLATDTKQAIIATAAIGDFGSAQFTARAIYQPESALVLHAAAAKEAKPRVVSRNGQAIAEYELR